MPLMRRNTRRADSRGTSLPGCAFALHHAEGWPSMRTRKPLFNELLTHFLMGVALGLFLILALTLIDTFHVRDLVARSAAPMQTMVILVGTYALMFGIGAALTGLVLTMEEEG
jgi:hypothetical protein